MSVVICRRVEGIFIWSRRGFQSVSYMLCGRFLACKWCQFCYVVLFPSVLLWIAVVKVLCMLYMLCLVWRYHFSRCWILCLFLFYDCVSTHCIDICLETVTNTRITLSQASEYSCRDWNRKPRGWKKSVSAWATQLGVLLLGIPVIANSFAIGWLINSWVIWQRFSIYWALYIRMPVTVAARSKAWIVFVHSNTGIVGSNPSQVMDVCVRLFYVCAVLCAGSGLATGWSPIQGVLPTV
jgi:hypothetical protein